MQWKKGSVCFLVIMQATLKSTLRGFDVCSTSHTGNEKSYFFSNLNSQLDILRLFHKYCISKVNLTCIYVKITQNSLV